MVFLVRANFGISTQNMRGYTVRIIWSVSILSIVALQYALFLSDLVDDFGKTTVCVHQESLGESEPSHKHKLSSATRPIPYFVCVMLAIFPFSTTMVSIFGRSQISNSRGSVINTGGWDKIEKMCFKDVLVFSDHEETTIKVFVVLSWLTIYLLALLRLSELEIPLEEIEIKLLQPLPKTIREVVAVTLFAPVLVDLIRSSRDETKPRRSSAQLDNTPVESHDPTNFTPVLRYRFTR
jgi:hypothetical protein